MRLEGRGEGTGEVDMAAGFDDVCLGHGRCHANEWNSLFASLHNYASNESHTQGTHSWQTTTPLRYVYIYSQIKITILI